MKLSSLVSISFLLVLGCSQLNPEAQDHYRHVHGEKVKHGLARVDSPTGADELWSERTPIDPSAVRRGRQLYRAHCLKCHGRQGRGDGPYAKNLQKGPADLREAVKAIPYFRFFIELSRSKGRMPGWFERDFTPRELTDLTHYLRALVKG